MTAETIIDAAQDFLHDDGEVWTRDELLTWLNDGYRQLLGQSHACVRPFQIDVPGRHAWSFTYEWEDRHAPGTFRKFTQSVNSSAFHATSRWEAEMIEGITSTESLEGTSQLWERTLSEDNDNRFVFATSRAHDMPVRIYWDDRRLVGASTRELDILETDWFQQGGRPVFAFPSNDGRDGSYEVYQMVTDYHQAYDLKQSDNGMPREFSGDRDYEISSQIDTWDYSYTCGGYAGLVPGLGYRITGQASDSALTFYCFEWEREQLESSTTLSAADIIGTAPFDSQHSAVAVFLGIGVSREIRSDDRQYVPAPYDSGAAEICGVPRDFKSSEDSLTIWEAIVPTRPLTEDDGLALVPRQFAKFLKYYILSRAFSRKGQGFRPDMAQHFTSLFQIGVALLKKIANQSFIDRVFARQSFTGSPTARPPQVQFPSNFERQF